MGSHEMVDKHVYKSMERKVNNQEGQLWVTMERQQGDRREFSTGMHCHKQYVCIFECML